MRIVGSQARELAAHEVEDLDHQGLAAVLVLAAAIVAGEHRMLHGIASRNVGRLIATAT